MKKEILCNQLYDTACQVMFTGHDPEELLRHVWQHLTVDDEHSDIRHHFEAMSDHEITQWQEKFSHVWTQASDLEAEGG